MDRKLINKYFRDQCSAEELEQVLIWFQTDRGKVFLKEDIDRQSQRFIQSKNMFLYPEINKEKIFGRIQLSKKRGLRRSRWFTIRVASVLLIAAMLSSALYWGGFITTKNKPTKPAFITYVTALGQQKIFKLSDGTKIRLNEKSTLIVPKKFYSNKRKVTLRGEAYFEVTHDPDHPFNIIALGSVIKDLGTDFNVKTDSAAGNVQVAVIQGKVALKKEGKNHHTTAILTRNHFGVLRLADSQITIEKGDLKNYLSWINKRLVFSSQSLAQVSRQLERLYNVHIHFNMQQLKVLNLTANIEKTDLSKVLTIISKTLDVHFNLNKNHVVWKE